MSFFTWPKDFSYRDFFKKCAKRDNLIKLYVVIWPTLVGIFWGTFNKRISKSTRNIFTWDMSIDLLAVTFWTLTFTWLILFLISVVIEDSASNIKFDRLRATILKAPNMSSFREVRGAFDYAFQAVEGLKQLKPEFQAEITKSDLSRKDALLAALNAINKTLLKLANDFFNTTKIDGVNCMLFFKNTTEQKQLIKNLSDKSDQLYLRCDYSSKLEGILYLDNAFIIKNGDVLNNKPMMMPIYSDYVEAYKNPNEQQHEIIIAGAMVAFRKGTSMVGNSRDIKKYYGSVDERTKKEITNFFHNSPIGKDVKSFASFKIPGVAGDPNEEMGILNFDSKDLYPFGEDEEFFATFYTLIYPTLKLYSEFLFVYKEYIRISP